MRCCFYLCQCLRCRGLIGWSWGGTSMPTNSWSFVGNGNQRCLFWKANLSKLKSVYALAQSPHLRRCSHVPVWTLKCVYCAKAGQRPTCLSLRIGWVNDSMSLGWNPVQQFKEYQNIFNPRHGNIRWWGAFCEVRRKTKVKLSRALGTWESYSRTENIWGSRKVSVGQASRSEVKERPAFF